MALATSCLALFFIIRAKKTFFLDSRFFIAVATLGFVAYVTEATYADITSQSLWFDLNNILVAIMGTSIAVASYLLRISDPERKIQTNSLKKFVTQPPRPFLLFLGIMLVWTGSSLAFPPSVITDAGGATYIIYDWWFVGVSAILLASFIGLPVVTFYQQSRAVKERTAALSIKIISLCWATFGISFFFQFTGGWLRAPSTQSFGFVVDSFLFILIAFALREPTILARIITAGEAVSQVLSIRSDVDTIILYNTESDRRKLIETFVGDGTAKGQTVICRVAKTEVPLYRAILKSAEHIDPQEGKQDVIIVPIEVDPSLSQLTMPFADVRELLDLDELAFERSKQIIDDIAAFDGVSQRTRNRRIWAINVETARTGIVDLLISKSPDARIIDLAKQQDVFSSLLGLRHNEILGRRMLLEYEPTSDYEGVVREFVREFQANVESIAVFTGAGSPVYRELSQEPNIRLFTFSTKTSTPSRISNEHVLLPERDTSLFLDAVDRLLQAYSGKPIGVVFEGFTYFVLSLGFEKAYGVISSIVEMAQSAQATILVLANREALDSRTLGGIRGLFQTQLGFDYTGLRAARLAVDEHGSANADAVGRIDDSLQRRVEA